MQIVLFSPESSWQFEKVFPSKSGALCAFERSLNWAEYFAGLEENSKIAVLCSTKNEAAVKNALASSPQIALCVQENWSAAALLEKMSALAKENGASYIIYANASAAFLDAPLSKRLVQLHTEYKAEYTFADGYPAGFSPEILDTGAAAIIAELCKTVAAEIAKSPVTKDAIFNVIKSDINSFEIETEIASYDYRLLRMNFLCENKLNFLSAKNLAQKLIQENKTDLLELDTEKTGEENVIEISNIAKDCVDVLKTVPAFYNVQINCSCKTPPAFSPYAQFFEKRYGENILSSQKQMSFSQFSPLCDAMKDLSKNAVVSLSLFGEAALHSELDLFVQKIFQNRFDALLEIDASAVKDFFESPLYKKILDFSKEAASQGKKIYLIILLDAFEEKTFSVFHNNTDFEEVKKIVKSIAQDFSETYVQFTRTTQNEDELEKFYRFWSEKESPTKGKIIIQKYDNFCGTLPSVKTADLAPVTREPCWHLRRDMEILFDGSVPLCREVCVPNFGEGDFIGNVFETPLEEVWKKKNSVLKEHVQKDYKNCCGKCDEYYVFNF